jgi:hypothetical protein
MRKPTPGYNLAKAMDRTGVSIFSELCDVAGVRVEGLRVRNDPDGFHIELPVRGKIFVTRDSLTQN